MISTREEYIQQLRHFLKKQKQVDDICEEYNMHIIDILNDIYQEQVCSESEAMKIVINKLGSPKKIASLYQEEFSLTAKKTQCTFFFANMCFFIFGSVLTSVYHLIPTPTISKLWVFLTSSPFIVIILYFIYWLLLGYELGKEFGISAKKLLIKTFLLSLIPNVALMSLIIFRLLPISLFAPLLTPEFILICVVFTVLLYPICCVGFRFGTLKSV